MSLFNQYSYLIGSLVIIVVVLLAMRRFRGRRLISVSIIMGILVLLLAGFLIFQPGSSDVTSVQIAEAMLKNGKPTFLEFFSNYCLGCMAARPAVDELVEHIEDDYNILRVNIHTDFGGELWETIGFSFSPEFILFDSDGEEIWRDHRLPTDDQLQLANTASP